MAAAPTKFTAVQHSGFGYAHKLGFKQGLEVRQVVTLREQRAVEKAGGLLFDNYSAADKFCDDAMFPADANGMYPKAAGSFASLQVDGLAVYIPVRETTVVG